MEKVIFIALLIIASAVGAKAQVTIQKSENRFEYPIRNNYKFMFDTEKQDYYLTIRSTNEFESETLRIRLGNAEEAVASLEGILSIMQTKGNYKISGQECIVPYVGVIYFINIESLEYTAGDYILSQSDASKFLIWLNNNNTDKSK